MTAQNMAGQRRTPFFPHRRNSDETYNSICLTCLETVASYKAEEELEKLDAMHVCKTGLVFGKEPETPAELE
jgi:hypothetical protein